VSADEVRIHPVGGVDGRPYPKIEVLRREVWSGAIESEIVRGDEEFGSGRGAMPVQKKGA
jgi:hypothetical protein